VIGVSLQIANLPEVHRNHEHFVADNARMLDEAAELAGKAAVAYVQRYPGFKPRTGALQKATTGKVIRLGSGRLLTIDNPKAYADTIDGGSKPHRITAKNGKSLMFMSGGRAIFRRSVNHPGTKPYKTFYRATFSAYRSMGQDLTRRMTALSSRF
jgi:hypothetical protein